MQAITKTVSARLRDDLSSVFVILGLKGISREEVLSNMASFVKQQGLVKEAPIPYDHFIKREKQGTTAIGNGIALPEACWIKMSLPYAFILCRLNKPINFNSLDGAPVRIILASLGRDKDDLARYKPMAKITRLLKSKKLKNKFLEASSVEEINNLLE